MKKILFKKNIFKVRFWLIAGIVTMLGTAAIAVQDKIYIYAAASTTDVVRELVASYKKVNSSTAE